MNSLPTSFNIEDEYEWNTDDLSHASKVKPASIRVRYCRTGSFHGMKPIKTPSGRLRWSPEEFRQKFLRH